MTTTLSKPETKAPAKKGASGKRLRVYTANVNSDDYAHLPQIGAPDDARVVLCQETNYPLFQHHFSHMTHLNPANEQTNLAIALSHSPGVFVVTGTEQHLAHPSGKEMAAHATWNFQNKKWPAKVPTPPRGCYVVKTTTYGEKVAYVDLHQINSPGYTGHKDEWTPARKHLWDLEWAVVNDVIDGLHADGYTVIAAADANRGNCPSPDGMVKVAGKGLDYIWVTKGAFTSKGATEGAPAGHKGDVHHKSQGVVLTFV